MVRLANLCIQYGFAALVLGEQLWHILQLEWVSAPVNCFNLHTPELFACGDNEHLAVILITATLIDTGRTNSAALHPITPDTCNILLLTVNCCRRAIFAMTFMPDKL